MMGKEQNNIDVDFDEEMQGENRNQEIKKVQKAIKDVLGRIGKMSENSQNGLTLFEQLKQLNPLFRQFGAYLHCLDDQIQHDLYIKFRNVFKEFKEGVSKKITIDSYNALENPEKMKEIKDNINKVSQDLNQLCKNLYEESKRYIIWVDNYDNEENQNLLFEFKLKYSAGLSVHFYSDVEKFKQEFKNYFGQPVFLIMSGQVANDYSPYDKKLFKYIKDLYNGNQNQIRIRGIIIYASIEGVKHIKDKFKKDDSNLVKEVTSDPDDLLKTLDEMISPRMFCRVIDLDDLTNIFEYKLKSILLSLHKPQSNKSILDYNPHNKIDLNKIFNQAKEIIDSKKGLFIEQFEFKEIQKQIYDIYDKYQNNSQEIAKGILTLYTQENPKLNIQFYNIINNTLNTVNEELIQIMMPLIEMLQIALYTYDDQFESASIKKGQSCKLYRGTSIPIEYYQTVIKHSKFICLPSFSSFTINENVAKRFVVSNSTYPNSKPCLLIYEHFTGSEQYEIRPKYMESITSSEKEFEFLTYPFVAYKITSIKEEGFFSTITLTCKDEHNLNASYLQSQFNNYAQQKQEEDSKQNLKEVQNEIKNLLGRLGKMSDRSQNAMSLFDQLQQLSPLFRQFGAHLHCLDDQIQHNLYLKFRNVFKEFKEGVSKKITLESQDALNNPEKMKEIKANIDRVAKDLNQLCQNLYEESKRYLIWVDTNNNVQNKHFLFELQLKYSPGLTVQFYSDVDKFKSELNKYLGQPIFLIMSGQVANDYSPSDKKLFNYIKSQYNLNKQQVKIRGIVIYASQQGVIYIKDKFENDDSKLVKKVTSDPDEMLQVLDTLISPSKFSRVINFDDLPYFFDSTLKRTLLNLHKPQSNKSLLEYKPDKIQLSKIFEQAKEMITYKNIHFYEEFNFKEILKAINNIYDNNPNNPQEIAKQILKLYTQEGQNIQFYQIINNTLNTLNEGLIQIMMPLIEMLQIALFTYDDSFDQTFIKKGVKCKLYRGTSIPKQQYDTLINQNQFICFPSFSSFTTSQDVAQIFIMNNSNYDDSEPCLLIYEHQTGSEQYEFRPKSLRNITYTDKKDEDEFLTYPFVTYKILSVEKKDWYNIINLTLN
ncbi:hypothetical protein ABPG74_020206 [Tetrahymena malaccensis]